jgi:hypothetical protein
MTTTTTRALGALLALTISIPAAAWSQERVGVATTVVGPVTVTRVAAAPEPLKFKDDIRLNDRVATGDKAFTRMLLGGKAIVTAREHSVVTITEVPGTSTIDLASGRISVAVDKSRMRPGEVIEIKTPNAVSGIRGTIVVAEALGGVSTITVLRGLVDVYRRDPLTGSAIGSATPVGLNESVAVKASVLPARPQAISVDTARRLSGEFTAPVRPVSPTSTMSVAAEVARVQTLLGQGATGKGDATPGRGDALAGRVDKADRDDRGDTPGNGNDNGTRAAVASPTATVQPIATVVTPTTLSAAMPTIGSLPTLETTPIVTTREVAAPFKHPLKTK